MRRKPYTISATVMAEVVNRPCSVRYVAAFAAMTAFFDLMISERMSVSSRRLLIDRAHSSGFAPFVSDGAHPVNEVRIVCHQPKQRRCPADWPWLWGVLLDLVRGLVQQPQPLVARQ